MDNEKLVAAAGVMRSAVTEGVLIVILARLSKSGMLDVFRNSGENVMATIAAFFSILLFIALIICTMTLIHSAVWCFLVCCGKQGDPLGIKLLEISNLVKNAAGSLISVIMGAIAVIFPVMAAKSAGNTDDKGLYVVIGCFALVGLFFIVSGIIGIVRAIKNMHDRY